MKSAGSAVTFCRLLLPTTPPRSRYCGGLPGLRFNESHNLPALLLGRLDQDGMPELTCRGDEPEQLSRLRILHGRGVERRRRANALQICAMTLRAILSVEFLARSRSLRHSPDRDSSPLRRRGRVVEVGSGRSEGVPGPRVAAITATANDPDTTPSGWSHSFPPAKLFYREIKLWATLTARSFNTGASLPSIGRRLRVPAA